ncbi:MAG: hypothetical protein JNJ54_35175 [Myxococcaceae bacterium]|nr:hypothetical protein [Myxococcaceae bacterium]
MSRPAKADTKCARLRAFMADGAWYAAAQLAEVGGSRFPARLHEIRRGADGDRPIDYECRSVGGSDTAFEYRLLPHAPEPEKRTERRRQSAAELIRHQAEEIARLTAELAKLRTERRAGQAELFGGGR